MQFQKMLYKNLLLNSKHEAFFEGDSHAFAKFVPNIYEFTVICLHLILSKDRIKMHSYRQDTLS